MQHVKLIHQSKIKFINIFSILKNNLFKKHTSQMLFIQIRNRLKIIMMNFYHLQPKVNVNEYQKYYINLIQYRGQ